MFCVDFAVIFQRCHRMLKMLHYSSFTLQSALSENAESFIFQLKCYMLDVNGHTALLCFHRTSQWITFFMFFVLIIRLRFYEDFSLAHKIELCNPCDMSIVHFFTLVCCVCMYGNFTALRDHVTKIYTSSCVFFEYKPSINIPVKIAVYFVVALNP